MPKILLLGSSVDVRPILDALEAHPGLWDQQTGRTADPASPHHGLSDIWVRFGDPTQDNSGPHKAIWLPPSDHIPVRHLAAEMMSQFDGEELGGILITRIPAGRICMPHSDQGWHAKYYEKFAVQIKADPRQEFCFDGERLVTEPGDLFWFDNSFTHWVTNPSTTDRITLIFCIKTEICKGLR